MIRLAKIARRLMKKRANQAVMRRVDNSGATAADSKLKSAEPVPPLLNLL
jgi:hypothetical protein